MEEKSNYSTNGNEHGLRFHKENDRLILKLIHDLSAMNCGYDLSDFGNVIGNIFGNDERFGKENGFETESFMYGFRHGVSIADGTHG